MPEPTQETTMLARLRRLPAHEALGLRFGALPAAGRLALGLALAALWLLGRRYGGLSHDATVYLAQGLRRLDPQAFRNDLFFAGGAQDDYTIFPLLYAPLIDALGVAHAALALTVAGQLAFLAAAALLASRLADGAVRWWSLALLAAVSGYYGGVGVFRMGEPFATARLLAEPLVIFALASTLLRRHLSAAAVLLVAALLHPLVAMAGIATLFVFHAMAFPRLLWLLLPAGAAGLAALAQSPALGARFDPAWRAAVEERSPHVFLALWHAADWARVLWSALIACVAAALVATDVRRLVLAALAVALSAIVASGLAVDLLDSAAVAALQPWRAHWVLHLLAILLLPVAVLELWRMRSAEARVAAAALAASCCFGRAELPVAAALALLAHVLSLHARRGVAWLTPRTEGMALTAVCAAAAVGLLFEIQSRLPLAYIAEPVARFEGAVHALSSVGGLLPLAAGLWLLAHARERVAVLASAAAVCLALVAWDARDPWQRFIEEEAPQANPFSAKLEPGAAVYWRDAGTPTWIALRTASWFTVNQGAGIVFSRETALHYAERKRAQEGLTAEIADCSMANGAACAIGLQQSTELCSRDDAPDALVLNGPVKGREGTALERWRLPPRAGRGNTTLHLYACSPPGNKKAGS